MDLLLRKTKQERDIGKKKKKKTQISYIQFQKIMTSLGSMGPKLNIFHRVSPKVLCCTVLRFAV